MVLIERSNRRRLILPLFLLVLGAWLFHGGAAIKALLLDSSIVLAQQLHWLTMVSMTIGLLLMPCAMLHGVYRASTTGFVQKNPFNSFHIFFYLPLLLSISAAFHLSSNPNLSFAVLMVDWIFPYAVFLSTVNIFAGIRFIMIRTDFITHWARLFALVSGCCLLLLATVQIFLFFFALPLWPEQQHYWLLLISLSPLIMALLISYFILQYNFMQLVLERIFVYGVVVVAAMLFHQIFLQELWQTLSSRYQINFAIVEGIILIALVILIKPLRQRSAEALRYLLGSRISELRRNTRELAINMSMLAQTMQTPQQIADWFCSNGLQQLNCGPIALWLINEQQLQLSAGQSEHYTESDVCDFHYSLMQQGQSFCVVGELPDNPLGERLRQSELSLAIRIEHPSVNGLVIFLKTEHELNEEQINSLVIVVEQLAIAISNCQLQASRLAAERRAHQNEKLSTLGLIASSIAHEVKNPLASIKTIATVMAEDLEPSNVHSKDVDLIICEVDRLNTTVNKLLRFARPADEAKTDSSISTVINDILHIMGYLATKNGVSINSDIAIDLPLIAADENTLREIFFNLMVNAVEAAGAQGQVAVTATVNNDEIMVVVRDSGVGISPEMREQLFQPFVSDKPSGTGLGLYLVARHVNDLGGTIECISKPEQGTQFIVKLPY